MEFNSFPLFYKENLRTRPQDFVITDETIKQVNQQTAQMRAERDKNNPAFAGVHSDRKDDLRKEYNALRQTLFNLKQDAKCFEIRTNDAAGRIRIIEERINNTLKLKKASVADGNLRGERTYENAIQRLETELADAKEDFNKNKAWSGQAARALKAFDGHARIAELKAILDEPLPEPKK